MEPKPTLAQTPVEFSVVMPVYNEGLRLAKNVEQTLNAVRLLGRAEIILADDGSHDPCVGVADVLVQRFPREVRVLHLPHRGKGEAIRQGVMASVGKWVVALDSDLDLPPEQILFFVAILRVKKAHAVVGSKMHPDSTISYPWHRRILSWGYYRLVKLAFGLPIRDTQTGLKLIRRDLFLVALEQSESQGFTLDLELLVRLHQMGAVLVEAPVVVVHSVKFGGIGLRTVFQIFIDTWHTWWRTRSWKGPRKHVSDFPENIQDKDQNQT
jgi:glycosyltransferase involved in cell wall biosynthesis